MDWWLIIVIAVGITIGMRVLRARKMSALNGADKAPGGATDFTQDREDNRVSRLSTEDRAWEDASLQRNRDAQARDEGVAEPRA